MSLLPSKIKCGNQYVLSLPLTARTIQYLIGLKLCGIDCSDQDTGQATIVLKLSICSTKERDNSAKGYVGWRKKSATASYNK